MAYILSESRVLIWDFNCIFKSYFDKFLNFIKDDSQQTRKRIEVEKHQAHSDVPDRAYTIVLSQDWSWERLRALRCNQPNWDQQRCLQLDSAGRSHSFAQKDEWQMELFRPWWCQLLKLADNESTKQDSIQAQEEHYKGARSHIDSKGNLYGSSNPYEITTTQ